MAALACTWYPRSPYLAFLAYHLCLMLSTVPLPMMTVLKRSNGMRYMSRASARSIDELLERLNDVRREAECRR